MNLIRPTPITASGFNPYGDLISLNGIRESGKSAVAANQGSAMRINHVAEFLNFRPQTAPPNVAIFQCEPRKLPFEVKLLEKHPHSTQIFIPMNAVNYFVITALGDSKPDFSTMKIFLCRATDAIAYRPGVWHHPMIAVSTPIDFVCFVHEDDTAEDCLEYHFSENERFSVDF